MTSINAAQATYWDRVANEKRFSHPLKKDWLARYLNSNSRILDYGCGYGRTLAQLISAGYQNAVGVDFSQAMLARCRDEVSQATVVLSDGHSIPLQADSCDTVLLFAVLTCIPGDDEQRRQLAEVMRVLRPGGVIYISDLLVNHDARNRERYERDAARFKCYGVFELPEGVVVRHHSEEWVQEIARPFEQLEYESFTVTTMNGNSSAAFQYLGRKSG